jgi:hypothetical protein
MNTVEFGPWLFAMSGRSQRVGRQPGHGERHLHQAPPDPIRRRRHPHRRRCKPRVHDRLLVRQRRATLQRPPDQHSRRYRAGDSHDGWCAVRRNRRGCYPCPCCSLSSPSYCIGIEHEGGAIADTAVIAALPVCCVLLTIKTRSRAAPLPRRRNGASPPSFPSPGPLPRSAPGAHSDR